VLSPVSPVLSLFACHAHLERTKTLKTHSKSRSGRSSRLEYIAGARMASVPVSHPLAFAPLTPEPTPPFSLSIPHGGRPMPNTLDSIRLCRCFDADRADLVRYLPDTSADAVTRVAAVETEHYLPLRPEASCLQRWLDLNA
jgi:hypothetical protein